MDLQQSDFVSDLGFEYAGKMKELVNAFLEKGYSHHSDTGKDIHNSIKYDHLTLIFKKKECSPPISNSEMLPCLNDILRKETAYKEGLLLQSQNQSKDMQSTSNKIQKDIYENGKMPTYDLSFELSSDGNESFKCLPMYDFNCEIHCNMKFLTIDDSVISKPNEKKFNLFPRLNQMEDIKIKILDVLKQKPGYEKAQLEWAQKDESGVLSLYESPTSLSFIADTPVCCNEHDVLNAWLENKPKVPKEYAGYGVEYLNREFPIGKSKYHGIVFLSLTINKFHSVEQWFSSNNRGNTYYLSATYEGFCGIELPVVNEDNVTAGMENLNLQTKWGLV